MGEQGAGIGMLAGGALLWLGVLLLSPFPTSPYALERDVTAAGTLDASRLLVATGDGEVHSYDAANGTTYLFVTYCSHELCGALVPVKGDLRAAGGLPRGALLDPVDASLSFVDAPPIDPDVRRDALGIRSEGPAYSSLFEVRSPWPVFLPRLLAVALAGMGAGLLSRPVWRSAMPGALGATAGLLVARMPMGIILAQIAVVPLVLAAAVAALVALARRRRGWGAAGILWFAAVMLGAGFLAFFHFPPASGAGD